VVIGMSAKPRLWQKRGGRCSDRNGANARPAVQRLLTTTNARYLVTQSDVANELLLALCGGAYGVKP
jgi:hypothetical protein